MRSFSASWHWSAAESNFFRFSSSFLLSDFRIPFMCFTLDSMGTSKSSLWVKNLMSSLYQSFSCKIQNNNQGKFDIKLIKSTYQTLRVNVHFPVKFFSSLSHRTLLQLVLCRRHSQAVGLLPLLDNGAKLNLNRGKRREAE